MKRIYMNDGWMFAREYEEQMQEADYDCKKLEEVRLPHSCVETPLHYFDESIYQMVCGYRKVLKAPQEWEGKSVLLTFEGAAHDSKVYVNGKEAGCHHCGYTAFTLDISKYLKYGQDNVIAVRLDSRESLNVPPFGFVIDYMTYGGIYRDVYLEIGEPVHLTDVFLKSNITLAESAGDGGKKGEKDFRAKSAALESEVSVSQAEKDLRLRQILQEPDGNRRVLGECPVETSQTVCSWDAGEVQLWDVEQPSLYVVETQLWKGETMLDSREELFGFRQAFFQKDGFYLNGRKVKLRGLNRHQSYPYVGYAMPASIQRMDADILKDELGLNAVRTAHYPQSQDFIRRCDERGFLVFTELPGWQHIGDQDWKDQAVENVRDMVLQYRNHPSIILWGVRINESQDDDEFYRRTNAEAHRLDPTRQTGGVRFHKKSSFLEDVYTYNDFVHEGDNRGCEPKSKVTPDEGRGYLISEYNGHMYPTKSFDDEVHRLEHALRHANVLQAAASQEDIAGSFGWCMFDYNTHRDFGSGDRICYHGVMDMFRNPKLAASVYASWREDEPMLEVSSTMDIGEHPACNRGDTYLFTNAAKVRMYKNGKLLKEYTPADSNYPQLPHGPIPVDDFVGDSLREEKFPPGQEKLLKQALNDYARYGMGHLPRKTMLKALWLILRYRMNMHQATNLYNKHVGDWGGASSGFRFEALDADGNVLKTVVREPVTSVSLCASCSSTQLREERGYDAAAVRIRAVDQNGNVLPFFQEPVTIETEGVIEAIGPRVISLQGGMGGTYIRSTGCSGTGRLILKNGQMDPVVLTFTVEAGGK